MKFHATFILLAAACMVTAGCAARPLSNSAGRAVRSSASAASTPVADEPISIAQTNIFAPAAADPSGGFGYPPPAGEISTSEPLNQTAKPRSPAAPRPEPRQPAGVQVVQGPAPPPGDSASSRPHIRPVEPPPAERSRMLNEIGALANGRCRISWRKPRGVIYRKPKRAPPIAFRPSSIRPKPP